VTRFPAIRDVLLLKVAILDRSMRHGFSAWFVLGNQSGAYAVWTLS
jgi:hypothetical protein